MDFIQLSWADAGEEKFGSAFLVETDGPLQPQRLDPTENLTPLLRSRGAEIKSSNGYGWQDEPLLDLAFDGDYETAYTGLRSDFGLHCGTFTATGRCKTVWIQFRGFFPIRRLVLQPTPDHHVDRFMPNLQVGTNNAPVNRTPATLALDPLHGTREGRLTWRGNRFVDFDVKIDIRENTTAVLDLELPDEPVSELILAAGEGNWELAELEIYGDGFVSQAAYISNIIDLGGALEPRHPDLVGFGRRRGRRGPECAHRRRQRPELLLATDISRRGEIPLRCQRERTHPVILPTVGRR